MTAMLRAVSWPFRGLHHSSVPLSARKSSNRADRSCALAEKVAMITGSTKGIGLAIAQCLARDRAHVVVSSQKQQNVDRAVVMLQGEGLSITGTVCHVGKAKDREQLVATILYVNAKSPALGLRQLLPHMESRGTGSVVLVSSLVAYVPIPKLGVYNTSKAALLGLCKTLAVELAPKGIRMNCLVPGIIKTDFIQVEKSLPYLLLDFNDIYGLQRFGKPEECAGIVSFLCSPDASYITGENIMVAAYSPKL